ncbi:unnamed protein product [Adineta ricciae]|uniref:SSD domain-containing protein n=1 Tax=Adineta ricciae TaxID=249248 RepID=A0A814F0T8_ADIRI|nr:unnamed protein product [Adineta ricciae]
MSTSVTNKDNQRYSMGSNRIQERSDRFWNGYSKILIRFTQPILLASLVVTVGLTVCFFYFVQIRQFDQTDFIVRNGKAQQNAQRISEIFGNDKDFRAHQQMDLYPALDIIIKRKLSNNSRDINETNMLNKDIIEEIRVLDRHIQSVRINNSKNSLQYNFSALCAVINHACVVDGNYLLSDKFRQDALLLPHIKSGIYFDSLTGANGLSSFIFSKDYKILNTTVPEEDYVDEEEEEEEEDGEKVPEPKPAQFIEVVSYVPLFRIRYSLNISTDAMRSLALQWEREVLRYLNEKFHSSLIHISPSTSTAISDIVGKQARDEGPFMTIMLLIFFIFVGFFISIQGNSHTSVGYLSLCGVINLALASGATFGLLAVFKLQIIEPMALIVFAVAIIDSMRISIVCGEYHRIIKDHLPVSSNNVATKIDIEKILPLIIKSSRPYFLSTTLILIIVYLVLSLLSPMSCTRYLGLTLVLYVFIDYLTHCTFFSACLVFTLKRIKSRRHCLLCHHLPNDHYIKDRRRSFQKVVLEKPLQFWSNRNAMIKKFCTGFLCLISFGFIIFSVWSLFSIDTHLFEDRFLPKNATTLKSYMNSHIDQYNIGPVIMFVIPQPINYENKKNQALIRHLLQQCLNEPTTNQFKLLWLDQENIHTILTSKDPMNVRVTPYSQNDIIVSEINNKTVIKASRFYCQYQTSQGDRNDLQTMNNMYTYAKQSSIPSIFPYSFIFAHYESLAQIRTEIYLLMLFVVLTTFVIIFIIFTSFEKGLLLFSHMLALQAGSLTCLYLFHDLTFNFANALWLFIIPIIFCDTLIHASFNITKSKWKYNRVLLSLIISLSIFSLFSIETYIFHIIRLSLLYQTIICFVLINFILPSWHYLIERMFKKAKEEKLTTATATAAVLESSQPLTASTEIQNLVYEPNGNTIVDGGADGEIRYPNNHPYHTHHVDAYQKLLEDILETELRASKSNLIDLQSLERTRKGIERGDPREFMG